METNRYQRMKDMFAAVVDAPAHERAAILRDGCNGDDALRREVESLLQHVDAPAVNIDRAADQAQAALSSIAVRSRRSAVLVARSQPGDRIGGYRILSVLGEGGMGIVYLAEQDRPRRTVALKVIKPGYVSAGMLRRFEHETQVLGRLQHPGIAQIFEAGTAEIDGGGQNGGAQPYFAMEYVRGKPLLEYADAHDLGTRERLELLIRVCDAVHHAHSQGVIHRDLKPANILVEVAAADGLKPVCPPCPNAKILDFGIARSTDADIHTTTLRTDIGQLIGTIPYMSPEQVAGDPNALDARSDIYALGVIGYELLTGRLPHDLRGKTIPEAVRIIGERDPTSLSSVNRFFRGDLDTIISKALERERARRYATASELAADIQRYLQDHPIVARPPSMLYQMRKFAKRNRAAVTALSAVFIMLLISIIAVSIYAFQATIARDEARSLQESESQSRKLAIASADRLREQLAANNIERGRLLGFAGNIREAEGLLWSEHLRDPTSLATHWALWELYAREPCMATMRSGTSWMTIAALTPDGRLLLTAGEDGHLRFWNPGQPSFEMTRDVAAHDTIFHGLTSSSDSTMAASAGDDGRVRIWNLADGALIRDFPVQAKPVRAVEISPDQRLLATGGSDGVIRLWNMQDASLVRELRGHTGSVVRVRFSHDGASLYSASADGRIGCWAVDRESDPPVLTMAHEGGTADIVLSKNGDALFSGGWDQAVRIWDTHTWENHTSIDLPNGAIRFVALTNDERIALVGGWWRIERVDLTTRTRLQPLAIPSPAMCGAVNIDGSMLIAGFENDQMRAWDLRPDAGVLRLSGHDGRVAATFSPDGQVLAAADNVGTLRIWSATDGSLVRTIRAHTDRVRSLAFHPSQPLLFTGALDGFMRVWNTETGDLVREFKGHNAGSSNAIEISADGTLVAYTLSDQTVNIISWPEGELLHTIRTPAGQALSARFSPDGETLIVTSRGDVVAAWDWRNDQQIATLATPTMIWMTTFSPDGSTLYGGAWTKEIRTWDMRTLEPGPNFEGHNGLVSDVKVRPGEPRVLASASTDGTVKLWDATNQRCLATLTGFGGWEAITVSFSPDGKRLAGAGRNGEVVIWDLWYYDRFIAGNIEHQRALRGNESHAVPD